MNRGSLTCSVFWPARSVSKQTKVSTIRKGTKLVSTIDNSNQNRKKKFFNRFANFFIPPIGRNLNGGFCWLGFLVSQRPWLVILARVHISLIRFSSALILILSNDPSPRKVKLCVILLTEGRAFGRELWAESDVAPPTPPYALPPLPSLSLSWLVARKRTKTSAHKGSFNIMHDLLLFKTNFDESNSPTWIGYLWSPNVHCNTSLWRATIRTFSLSSFSFTRRSLVKNRFCSLSHCYFYYHVITQSPFLYIVLNQCLCSELQIVFIYKHKVSLLWWLFIYLFFFFWLLT